MTSEHQIAVQTPNLGERAVGSLIWCLCKWGPCPASPAVPLGSLFTFPCRAAHPCSSLAPYRSAKWPFFSRFTVVRLGSWKPTVPIGRTNGIQASGTFPCPIWFCEVNVADSCPGAQPAIHQPNPVYTEVRQLLSCTCAVFPLLTYFPWRWVSSGLVLGACLLEREHLFLFIQVGWDADCLQPLGIMSGSHSAPHRDQPPSFWQWFSSVWIFRAPFQVHVGWFALLQCLAGGPCQAVVSSRLMEVVCVLVINLWQ